MTPDANVQLLEWVLVSSPQTEAPKSGSSVRQPFQRVKANGDPAVHFAVERKVVLTKSHMGLLLDIPQTNVCCELVKMKYYISIYLYLVYTLTNLLLTSWDIQAGGPVSTFQPCRFPNRTGLP